MPAHIDPDAIPGAEVFPDLIEEHARQVGVIGASVRDEGAAVHTAWQGMAAVYSAPESGTLLGLMAPVSSQSTAVGDNLQTVSAALLAFATEVRPIKAELDSLRTQARAFVANVVGPGVQVRELNPAWVSTQSYYGGSYGGYTPYSSASTGGGTSTTQANVPQYRWITKEWHEHQPSVDRNNELIAAVNAQQVALWEAERACANKIRALYGGAPLRGYQSESDPLGYGLDEIPEGTEMPWGAPVERTEGCGEATVNFVFRDFLWEGIAVGGVWGTIEGLGTLVLGYNPETGDWFSGDAYGAAWGNLGMLAAGLVLSSGPLGAAFAADELAQQFGGGFLPDQVRDFKDSADEALLNTGKALIAWDKWQDDPGTALGETVFNIGTILIPVGGAVVAGVKTASTAASVLSKMARVVDFVDPAAWAVNGGIRLGGAAVGSLDNLIGRMDFAARHGDGLDLQVNGVEVYTAVDSASAVRMLDEWGVDLNQVTARVTDGTPVLEFPGGVVELPAGAFDGALGDAAGTGARTADGGLDASAAAGGTRAADGVDAGAPVREPELVTAGAARAESGTTVTNSMVDDAPAVRTEPGGSGERTVVRDSSSETAGGGRDGAGSGGDRGSGGGGDDAGAAGASRAADDGGSGGGRTGDDGDPGAGRADGADPADPAPGAGEPRVVDPMEHLGPAEIDRARPGGDLVPASYDPFGGLTRDEFLARHWDSAKVNDWDKSVGGWDYPPNEGFDVSPGAPDPRAVDLPEGYRFDRFGGTGGEYVSPEGTSFPARALPPDSLSKPYSVYELIRPFDDVSGRPVAGRIAGAFEQPGGGLQFKLPRPVQWLLDNGYIAEVRP